MLLVVPLCARDQHLVLELIPWLRYLGPYHPNHHSLLVFAPDVSREVQSEIREGFKSMGFAGNRYMQMQACADGWPEGPNGLFSAACEVAAVQPQQAFLFFEPDVTPLRRGWLDDLEREWRQDEDKPFLGVLEPTRVSLGDGEFMEVGRNMMGAGVYPRDVEHYCAPGDLGDGEPFDLRIARDIIAYARHTSLIQNNWSTCRYFRDEAGKIQCEKHEKRVQRLAGEPVARAVRSNAALVHGCKDGSLVRLLMKEHMPPVIDEKLKQTIADTAKWMVEEQALRINARLVESASERNPAVKPLEFEGVKTPNANWPFLKESAEFLAAVPPMNEIYSDAQKPDSQTIVLAQSSPEVKQAPKYGRRIRRRPIKPPRFSEEI